MGERTASSLMIVTRKSLFCLFTFTSLLFVLSWVFVLRSTSRPQFIDNTLLPNSKLLAVIDHAISATETQNDVESSVGNRSILVDKEEEDKSTSSSRPNDGVKCDTNEKQVLKVFMYDLPTEFHFGLLDWKPKGGTVWPDLQSEVPHYPGGLNLQHSIEYWLTLDLLASELPSQPNARFAIRVLNVSEADIIFVPFFSSLSYNRFSKIDPHQKKSNNKVLQDKLVQYLTAQKEWKDSGGRDHLIVAHHPNSLLDARMKLWPATFILSDFGRYPPNIANVEKDVIAPYKHVIKTFESDSSTFESRPTLLYFQGAIYRKDGGFARQELFYLLKDEKDVHFAFGTVQKNGIRNATQGMHSSKFCLNIAGDTPSSNRLFDAIASHCVPVIISDDIELPYEDVLDYSEFCIFVRTSDAVKKGHLVNLIRSIGRHEWTQMWKRLQEVQHFYEFHYPSREGDAIHMIWKAVARKVPGIRLKLHKSKRLSHSPTQNKKGLTRIPSPKNFW
ncbi:PREDICTED: probable arabinosyltransferase ARAD1 [Fragaria vesca subsp. vesca]|uniref:probable arabinosyltransferase ARAD1 n=1 Tax=Fragaria vesca subsp. vesca TaxID=101020 RepID=UPI0002C34662|nr:PREDICTED: probable arabinosyltransferase ARAD1 [Fragaria vesca subsp. vesca]XP_011462778.1 PREDICTED: probable arabinosyltransferase ARAD1 [Fragaria vesca subsp. vesca]